MILAATFMVSRSHFGQVAGIPDPGLSGDMDANMTKCIRYLLLVDCGARTVVLAHVYGQVLVEGGLLLCPTGHQPATAATSRTSDLGWKCTSCSHCQKLCQQANWLLIGCTRVDNQLEARSAS